MADSPTSFDTLTLERDRGVAFVTIDHPPINLLDGALLGDLNRLFDVVTGDGATRVVVFRSANPEFFIAHADLEMIRGLPRDVDVATAALRGIHGFMERWRRADVVTIAQLEGRTRGGGSEFVLALDLRFAAIGRAVLGQPEVALGIIPGAGGTQRLARLVGRGRALEIVLGCADVDAELAERYGYVNRAFPPTELAPFVERLARRIAAFPAHAVRAAKRSVDAATGSYDDGLAVEREEFATTLVDPGLDAQIDLALGAGLQTREGELDLDDVVDRALVGDQRP